MRRCRTAWFVLIALVAGCSSAAHRATSSVTDPTTLPTTTTSTTVAPTTVAPTTTTRPHTTTTRPAVPTAASSVCQANLADSISNTYSAHQLVTVESSVYTTDVANVALWQKSGSCWGMVAGPWSGYIGYNGFSDHKQEGDGKSPTGIYGFGPVIYGNASDPGVNETYHLLVCGDWWDEASSSADYNTFQHVANAANPCTTTSPWGDPDSEALWTEKAPYPSFAVINYNTGPIVAGAGSAIFLHASTGGATAGCVSVPLSDLDYFLRWMQPSQDPLIVMGPAGEIARF